MKSPREILLARHAGATPHLDALRRATLATFREATSPALSARPHWWQVGWRELIAPCRPIWAGVGVAWVLVVALQVAAWSARPARMRGAPPVPSDLAAQVLGQRRLLSELLSTAPAPPPSPKVRAPSGALRSRSDFRARLPLV